MTFRNRIIIFQALSSTTTDLQLPCTGHRVDKNGLMLILWEWTLHSSSLVGQRYSGTRVPIAKLARITNLGIIINSPLTVQEQLNSLPTLPVQMGLIY